MPTPRSPNVDKRSDERKQAEKMYLESKGSLKLVDIAEKLKVPANKVRKWKSMDGWEAKLNPTKADNGKKKQVERSTSDKGSVPRKRVSKNIIVVAAGPFQFAMINPVITKKTGAFQTEEGCLSLDGVRPCTRYKEIEVDYLDTNFKKQHGKYIGWTAQIIQHEVDHCNGIVI